MPLSWTPEQVLSLAPDDASRKNASGLANPRRWLRLSRHETSEVSVLWGELQGSGSEPYRCQVDINGPAFKCTCPSRKLPCKHALGLFLLYAGQPKIFEVSAPPDWVTLWLMKRAEQSNRRAAKVEGESDEPPAASIAAGAKEPSTAAKARRAAERDRKIRAGLDDLETWLGDLLRQGLASAQTQPRSFWEATSARLVDAQAPGLARMVRKMPDLAASGEGWQERLLDQAARLYLAVEGYRHIQSLAEENQADLRSLVGITQKQEELRDQAGVRDTWLVLGRDLEEESGLRTLRTWLVGQSSGRAALILQFAAQGAALDASLSPGTALPAELVFYPGAYPLRAILRERGPLQTLPAEIPGSVSWMDVTAAYAQALAAYPWVERFPVVINQVRPLLENDVWVLYDAENRRVPLAKSFLYGWTLQSLSGGGSLGVFGEWDGEILLPLSAWSDGQFVAFHPHME